MSINNITDLKRELAERNAEIGRNKIEIKTIQGRLDNQERWKENAVNEINQRLDREIQQKVKAIEKARCEKITFSKTITLMSSKNQLLKEKIKQDDVKNAPLRDSVNRLTSERSRFLRKIKRLENK